jgi:hypothetical protein
MPAADCERRNHAAKRLEGRSTAEKGWYVRYGSKGPFPDGRNDLDRLSPGEVSELKEMAVEQDKADLEAFLAPTEEIVFHEEEGSLPGLVEADVPPKKEAPVAPEVALRRSTRPKAPITPHVGHKALPGRSQVTDKKSNVTAMEPKGERRLIHFSGEETLHAPHKAEVKSSALVYLLKAPDGRIAITGLKEEAEGWIRDDHWTLHGAFSDLADAALAFASLQGKQLPSTPPIAPMGPAKTLRAPSGGGTWYGLVSEQGTKSLVTSEEKVTVCQAAGFQCEAVFEDEGEARTWKGIPTPPKTARSSNKHTFMIEPAGGTLPVPKVIPYTDTSTQGDEVYGVKINRAVELDGLLLPVDVVGKEGRDAMFECATDVMALPGAYRRSDGGGEDFEADNTGAEAMIAMMLNRRETGLHLDFRSTKKNALKQIKRRGDVRDFLERVQEAYEEQEGTQVSQFTYVMEGMGYDVLCTQKYCIEGLLPRIIRDTYSAYVALITSVAGYTTDIPEERWKRSLPFHMLKHHSDKLGLIRAQSASYRELVLRNYAYMRNAKKDAFYNNKLNKSLWSLQASPSPAPAPTGGGGDRPKCGTCQRSGLHGPNAPCPLSGLTPSERVRLLASLTFRQQQKAAKQIKQALVQDPSMDHNEAIEAAREAAVA